MGSKVVSLARKAGRLAVRSLSGGIASAVKATRSAGKPSVSKTIQATGSAPAPILVARAATRADEASRAVMIDNIPVIPRVASHEELRASYDAESTLSLYMRHVGEVPLLTPEQEIVLAARIKQGDAIGYVGATGWATGPHLHYEFKSGGVHRDPLRVALPKATPLPDRLKSAFQQMATLSADQLGLLRTPTFARFE